MGSYLSTPCRDVDEELGSANGMQYGVGEMQGWRRHMEDAHISKPDLSSDLVESNSAAKHGGHIFSLFAVFDGHGGKEVAKFCKDYFVKELVKADDFGRENYIAALRETFHRMDVMIEDEASADLLQQYRSIPNPSDRKPGDTLVASRAPATSVGEVIEPQQPTGGRKIQYSRAMELFRELLRKEEEAKKTAMGLRADKMEDVKRDDDDEDDDEELEDAMAIETTLSEEKLLMTNDFSSEKMETDDEGELQLDLEVHGAVVPDEVFSAQSQWKLCQLADHRINAGCTAVVALRVDSNLYVANAGDSRAVLSRAGVAIQLSLDHKPSQIREYERIINAGGFVTSAGRVNGNLNLSRAIGDLKYKKVPGKHRKHQIISADPDITVTKMDPDQDEFLILACDGIWDCFTSQAAVDFVRERLINGMDLSTILKEVFKFCLAPDPRASGGIGGDNMTFIVVKFKDRIV